MQMKSSFRDADANGDGIITLDELTAKLGNYSQPRRSAAPQTASAPSTTTVASSGSSSRASSNGSGSSSDSGSSSKKSFRFLSPQERLPRGLPEWYSRKDADGDGQVSMSEYARSGWSDALADEFQKYDMNGDGVVTPEECLKASNSK